MNMKRMLSLILAFVMILGMFPASAFATEGGEDTSVDVVLSLSADESFMVGPGSGTIMAMKDITVPYFDLGLYGLEEYYFVSERYGDDGDGLPGSDLEPGTPEYAEGKVTLLHLYIYALEVFYCGIDPEEAGQGYLYDEGLIGTEVFSISGGVGSSFLNQFWGGDCNLNYYVNYEYPLASEGWGATSDQILLRDGDIITLGHFTGWSFYGDTYSIFNYIVADNENPVQGEEVTLTLYYAGANMGMTDGTAQNLNPYCLDVYYAPYGDIPSEDVTEWEYLGTADENGELVVDTADLEAGEYIIAVAGQYGVDYTDDICSTPGGVRITVAEPAHEHGYEAVVTAPTCTEGGYTTYTCECGDSYVADEVDALGHDFVDGVCTRCGEADPNYAAPFTYEITDTPSNGDNWAKLGKGTISGTGGVVKHIWGSGSLTVILTENTPDDAVITSSFATSGLRPSLSGTGEVTLVDGTARQTIKLSSPFGTVATWNVLYTKDKAPVLAEGQSAAAAGETGVNEAYAINLDGIFTDADGDALTHQISVDGGAYAAVEGSTYTYVPTVPGEHTLVFRANDGILNSDDTYTVTVTAKNSSVTYDVAVTAPEGAVFFAVGEVVSGESIKGDELVYENGVVKVPENITRIAWEADGLIGMSAPVSSGMALELVTVTFDVTLYSGESDAEAAIEIKDADGVTVTGTASDAYLLPALTGFSYKATASGGNSGQYNPGQLTDQTPAAGQVTIPLNIKHFTVIAPAGSAVSAGTLSGSFSYSFASPIDVQNVEDTVVYKFAPLSGAAFIRVQNPDDDAVTYWDYKSSKADGKTITVTEEMLFMNDAGTEGEFNANTVYRNFEYYSFDLGDIYMNINNQGYINMNVGDVKDLNMFRNWQAINSFTNDKIAVPDFEYEIVNIEGDNVISIVPDEDNTGAAVMTATGEGTAIVLVTYDAMYSELTATGTLGGEGGGNRLSAIWPDRTGVFVVSVGKDGTGIKSNMTCNGAIFDAEHSPQFYHGDEGASVSFTPEAGVTVTVNRSTVGEKKLSFGEFTSEGVTVNAETGEVTVTGLTTGRHIIRLEKDGVAAYQVVTATQTTVTMTDSEGNEISLEEKLQPGQTVKLTVTGLTSPAEKFATKYNFNCQITYKDQFGNAYSNSSGATYGKYDFSSIPQVVSVTIPEDWSEETLALNGFMKMGGFAGDGIGSHRKVSYGENRGMAWGSDAGMELGSLPEIVLNVDVKPAQYVPDENDVPVYQGTTWPSTDGYIGEIGVKDAKDAVGYSWSENYGANTVAVTVLLDSTKYENNTTFSTYYLTGGANPPEVEAWGEDENGEDLLTLDVTMSNETAEWWNNMNTMYYMIGSKYVGVTFVPAVYALNKSELTMEVGTSDKLAASLTYYSGPSDWESSNPDVVTVDDEGNITAVASGTATITANVGNFTAACVITVEEPCSHEWNDATCTEPKTCSKCGETEGEPLGHTEEVIPAVAPTCTETGLTEGKKCTVCGEITVAQTVVDALGHTEEIIPAVAATCYGEGLTEGKKCSVCGEILVVQEAIPANGHTMTTTVVAPEHEKMGYTFHECANCDYSFVSDWTEALGHEYEKTVTREATCTEDGEWTFTCSCGKSYIQVMPKTGHSCDAVVTDPTCTEIGYTTHTCANCDFSYITDIVAALGHTESKAVIENEVAVTCTKDGSYDSVVYCSVCNEELTRETVTVPAAGHTEEILPAAQPTCTETGLTEGKKCSVCGEILVAQEEIPALGHAWHGTGCNNCDAKRENPFTDVPEDSWFIDPVLWAAEEGITEGATKTTFNPSGDLLRAQVVTMLWRHAGSPVVDIANPFTDVKEGEWYYNAVLWAVSEGITAGTSATTFDPAGKTTRAQAVTFLWRYLGQPEAGAENPFADVNTGDWYGKAVLWAVANGVTEGMSDTEFGVGVNCSRAHMITFLYRVLA